MRLNLQTDYALRLLMHLAINTEKLSTIADVAMRYNISKNHLMKVAHVLGKENIIETVRGRAGGLRLAQTAEKIVIGDVVRLMEGDLDLVECFGSGACFIAPTCRLKGVLREALEAFLNILDQYTVEHLVQKNKILRELLCVEVA